MKEKGITLIALIITIIVLLILVGVTINFALGENGLFKIAQEARKKYEQAIAREKLEAVLVELQADKITKIEYNENGYIDNKLKENNMQVEGNVVTVDRWQFEIDRSIPKILKDLGNEKIEDSIPNKTYEFVYTGDFQEFEVKKSGWYRIECFGADGGKAIANGNVSGNGRNRRIYTRGNLFTAK